MMCSWALATKPFKLTKKSVPGIRRECTCFRPLNKEPLFLLIANRIHPDFLTSQPMPAGILIKINSQSSKPDER